MPVPTREPVPLGRSRRAHVPRANLVNWYTRRRSAAERQSGTVAMRQLAAREPARATNAGGAAARDECVGHARGRSIRSLRNRLLGGERRPWRPSLLAPAVPPSLLGRTAVALLPAQPVTPDTHVHVRVAEMPGLLGTREATLGDNGVRIRILDDDQQKVRVWRHHDLVLLRPNPEEGEIVLRVEVPHD